MLGTSHNRHANSKCSKVTPYVAKMAREEMQTARCGGLNLYSQHLSKKLGQELCCRLQVGLGYTVSPYLKENGNC